MHALTPFQVASARRAVAIAVILLSTLVSSLALGANNSVVVNTVNDGAPTNGVTSLRDAITLANGNAGGTTITFDPTVFAPANGPYTIVLSSALPDLTADVTIVGPAANVLTVKGPGAQVPTASFRIFRISTGCNVAISGLTIDSGNPSGTAGSVGVKTDPFTVDGTPPTNGTAAVGGAIYNSGNLSVSLCVFSNNAVYGGNGGVAADDTRQVGGNGADGLGGAIYTDGTALVLDRCTFTRNLARGGYGGHGGGDTYQELHQMSYYTGPTGAGGAAGNGRGGAIYVASGTASATTCTFANNTALGGSGGTGGLNAYFHNAASGQGGNGEGGGIYTLQPLSLTSCTVGLCQANGGGGAGLGGTVLGGGVCAAGNATVTIGNTLIAGNTTYSSTTSQTNPLDVFGSFVSNGFNLIGVLDSSVPALTGPADQWGTASSRLDAKLDTLGVRDNGGPVLTLGFGSGSPAVDRGKDLVGASLDQRGFQRPIDLVNYANAPGGDGSDIGAFESANPNLPPTTHDQSFAGVQGRAFTFTKVAASDVDSSTLTFSIISGTMPLGLTLNADGSITGTPTAPTASTVVYFAVSDGLTYSTTQKLTFSITEHASTVVNTDRDDVSTTDGLTSLREAVAYVQANGLNNPITFDPNFFSVPRTILLTSYIYISGNVTIIGAPAGVTISGGNKSPLFDVGGSTTAVSLTLRDLTLANASGSGGALLAGTFANYGSPTVFLINCTLCANGSDDAKGGAIKNNGANITLQNCTLTGNHADYASDATAGGGAIFQSSGSTTIENCTIVGNHANGASGGGLLITGGTVNIGNSIVALNSVAAGTAPDIGGIITGYGYNIFSDTTGLTIQGSTVGDQVTSNPGLDPNGLASNGGPTQTIKLLTGSPALDAGRTFGGATTDQRGSARPFDDPAIPNAPGGGDGSDIGAYEFTSNRPIIAVLEPAGSTLTSGSSMINFGTIAPGSATDLTFTVKNQGGATLALSGAPAVVISGANAADFTVTAQPAPSVAPTGSSTFTIHCAPSAASAESAMVTISNNDAISGAFSFGVTAGLLDSVTQAPTLTAPASNSSTSSPVSVAYHLPEAGLAGSVQLSFGGSFTTTLPNGSETAGDHTFTFDAKANQVADGTYVVTVSYRDALGNAAAGASSSNVRLLTAGPAIPGPFSPLAIFAGTPLPDYASQATRQANVVVTQAPLAGSATAVGTLDVTITAKDALGNQSTAVVPVDVRPVSAVTQTVAASFDAKADAPGAGTADGPPAGAKLTGFGVPAIDDDGTLAFSATWASSARVRGAGLFSSAACLARVGGTVPGLAPATYRTFTDPLLRGGQVAFIAEVSGVPEAKNHVLLSGPASNPVVVAQSGVAAPGGDGLPLAGGVTFQSFQAVEVRGSSLALMATLAGGSGSARVNASKDRGIWMKDSTHSLRLVLREGQTVGGHTVGTLLSYAVGDGSPGQGRGWLSQSDTGPKALALVIFTEAKGEAVVSADLAGTVTVLSETGPGAAGAPNLAGGAFASYSYPAANDLGDSAFLGSLNVASNVATRTTARGIFGHFANAGSSSYDAIVRVGTPSGVDGANFSVLFDPVLAANGDLAFHAYLGGGTARGLASSTLWLKPYSAVRTLIAQGGQRPGPDLPSVAEWSTFSTLAMVPHRGPIFSATMVVGKGGVTRANDSGVWATDFTGVPRLLFRTGDPIDGKTLKSFTLLNATVGSLGVTRSVNDRAEVAWRATFTDNSQAVVATEIP